MSANKPICDLYILSAVTDLTFISQTVQHQVKQCNVNGSKILRVDTAKVNGYYKKNRDTNSLNELLEIANSFLDKGLIDQVLKIDYEKNLLQKAYAKHFNRNFKETHCFRGYPFYGSILPFEHSEAEYIALIDSDMLIFQSPDFNWIEKAVEVMEGNPDILCCLPLSGPPTADKKLHQGNTEYYDDTARGLYLFKNFTSRIFVINIKKFLSLCPMEIQWLSWREPIYSKLFGRGKMLCWEATVSKALEQSDMYRADLSSELSWSLHPYERSKRFIEMLPDTIHKIENGIFPVKQSGHYELNLDWWE